MAWTNLIVHVASFEPAILNLAFVFLLLGYGTKVGLVPVHGWLPDAHGRRAHTDIGGFVRPLTQCRAVRGVTVQDVDGRQRGRSGTWAIDDWHGPASLMFGAFMLYRRRDIKRLFAYSSI